MTAIWNGDATVIGQSDVAPHCRKVTLRLPACPEIRAGQFCHLQVDTFSRALLRRPFSFWDVRPVGDAGTEVDLVYAVVGVGTEALSRKTSGEKVPFLGPLGCGFAPSAVSTYLFVAGGVGIVPFFLFAKQVLSSGRKPRILLLFGGRNQDGLYGIDDFPSIGVETEAATEDGSRGFRGRVPDLLEEWLPKLDLRDLAIYSCGPDPMMAAVARIAQRDAIPCQVSLECRMGCALGACGACVAKVKDGNGWRYARTCLEGPTMDASEWVWE